MLAADGLEWRPLRAAMIISRIATREFERQKLRSELTALAGKPIGRLQDMEAKDEVSFREALGSIGVSQTEIDQLVQQVLDITDEAREASV